MIRLGCLRDAWQHDPGVEPHDVHATILNQLGLDHKRLMFIPNGRGERATVNGGNLITELL